MRAIHLGTSGYVYEHWKGLFYPTGLPASRWLPYFARVFATVELNAPFYRLPTADAVDGWREQTPAGFKFACKGSRYLRGTLRPRGAVAGGVRPGHVETQGTDGLGLLQQ